jgi:hypothetical protein
MTPSADPVTTAQIAAPERANRELLLSEFIWSPFAKIDIAKLPKFKSYRFALRPANVNANSLNVKQRSIF